MSNLFPFSPLTKEEIRTSKMHVIRSSSLHDHPIRSEAIPAHQLHSACIGQSQREDDLSSARLETPTAHPLEVGVSIRKVPTNDDFVLTAAHNSASVELQLKHPVAAFAVVDGSVVGMVVGVHMCLCVSEAVSLGV